MKLYSSTVITYYLLAIANAQKNDPPYCKKVAEIIGEAESTKVPIGTPLPDHWAEYFGYENCTIGLPDIGCGWGHFTGFGSYYTGSVENWGFPYSFRPDYITNYNNFQHVETTKGWFLSDVCSMLRGDAVPTEEFLIFDSFQVGVAPPIPVGRDLTRTIATTHYLLNAEESPGCKGYSISFGFRFYGYGGTPGKPKGGCEYDSCEFKGEICKIVYTEDEFYADGPEIIMIDERNLGKKSKSSKQSKRSKKAKS